MGYHTMESVVSAARQIEKVLAEQADPKKELQMQEQIRPLQEGLEDVRRQIARSPAATTASSAAASCFHSTASSRSPHLPGLR